MRFSLLIIILVLFSGCRKYKENKGLILSSREKRIAGVYQFESLSLNSQDYLPLLQQDSSYCTIQINTLNENPENTVVYRYSFGKQDRSYWEFGGDAKIVFGGTYYKVVKNGLNPLGKDFSVWEISKLTKEELKMSRQKNDSLWEITLKKL